ncbi:MAG TPA: hypothetical protein PLP25_00785 [Candidatus Limiplasma sp.]|nr:hypothetical protein [Candidatus Limiplasma sp.]HPS80379.1 hypothetical protein [Candidatus Limiplasma sp.]
MKVFKDGHPFLKGNLHCHTTESDGVKTPEEAIAIYRDHGYDFLAITDHRRVTVLESRMEGNLLLLPGIELDYSLPGEVVHIVGFGMDREIARKVTYELGPQAGVDRIRAFGGRAIVAHPHWSLNTVATLTAIRDATAAEIYNTMSFLRPDSSCVLDVASAHGKLYPLVASDDTHAYEGEECVSYTMVQADANTPEAIIRAMDAGLFYASQGPRIGQLTLENGQMTVECSPVSRVFFHSNLVWTPGRSVIGTDLTRASYTLHREQGERFVRCQVIDAAGHSAWSSPIAL